MPEDVVLSVNGVRYGGWKDIDITVSMETLSNVFRLGVTEKWPGQNTNREIKAGDSCEVIVSGDTVITGYVDEVNPSYDARTHTLVVSGRDKAADLVDCSAINKPGQWRNQNILQITEELIQPFGISVRTEADLGQPFKTFNIEQGETVYECIERMCKLRGLLCISDGQGSIVFINSVFQKTNTVLQLGRNILSASGNFSYKDRYDSVTVKAQQEGSDSLPVEQMTGPVGVSNDSEINRYRPLLIIAEGQADKARCIERAEWEQATRKGKSIRASFKVAGWRQGNGGLWRTNRLVGVRDDFMKLNGDFVISTVNYKIDNAGGTVATISVTDPRAFEVLREVDKVTSSSKGTSKESKFEPIDLSTIISTAG